jgi:hypothetical protein
MCSPGSRTNGRAQITNQMGVAGYAFSHRMCILGDPIKSHYVRNRGIFPVSQGRGYGDPLERDSALVAGMSNINMLAG